MEDENEVSVTINSFITDDPKEKALVRLTKELESFSGELSLSRDNIEDFRNQMRRVSDERLLGLNMKILAAAHIYTYKANPTPEAENFPSKIDQDILESLAREVKISTKNPPKDAAFDIVKIKLNIVAYVSLILQLL